MKEKNEKSMMLLYFSIYLLAALTIALHQPHFDTPPLFGNPPDEHSRYKVPLYIEEHGKLPTGFEEELFSGECRWTYGFYTLLPYIVQGIAMKVVSLFTDSAISLLYTARMVNVVSGLLMAYIVMLIGRIVFYDSRIRWIFCFLVTFLPQSLFMHTYVNPDSFCLLSTALMIYGLLRGYKDSFSLKSCVFLTLGMVVCILSYYNAYGYLISIFLLFTAFYIKKKNGKWSFDCKTYFKKGCFIAAAVIILTGWSFARNYILYDGDFIGLRTKEAFIQSFGIARETFKSRGQSIIYMLMHTSFLPKVMVSFIANFGSGSIYTYAVLYMAYFLFFAVSLAGLFMTGNRKKAGFHTGLFHANMFFCILMPFILLVKYAYSVDYQAQGRYLMPALIPIMYYVCRGFEKLPFYRRASDNRKTIQAACVAAFIVGVLLIMVFCNAMPVYLETKVL